MLCTPSSTKSVVRNMVFSTSKPRNTSLQNQIFPKNGGHSIGVRKADFCRKFSRLNLSPKFWPQIQPAKFKSTFLGPKFSLLNLSQFWPFAWIQKSSLHLSRQTRENVIIRGAVTRASVFISTIQSIFVANLVVSIDHLAQPRIAFEPHTCSTC